MNLIVSKNQEDNWQVGQLYPTLEMRSFRAFRTTGASQRENRMKFDDEPTGTLVSLGSVVSAGRKSVAAESVTFWGVSSLPRLTLANPVPTLPRLQNAVRLGCERCAGRVKARRPRVPIAARQGGA
jgi:hypothetical protein